MRGTVFSLCDRTGNMIRPWLEAGYQAVTVDLQAAPATDGRAHRVADVRDLPADFARDAIAVFAFPPCTHLASSGARHFKSKGLGKLIEALQAVEACRLICEASGAPSLIENPIGTLSTYWRQPDYIVQPWWYARYAPNPEADGYTKKTCLWTGGGFRLPDKRPLEPLLGAMIHRMSPERERADKRSITPLGFACAVFEANAPHLRARAA